MYIKNSGTLNLKRKRHVKFSQQVDYCEILSVVVQYINLKKGRLGMLYES